MSDWSLSNVGQLRKDKCDVASGDSDQWCEVTELRWVLGVWEDTLQFEIYPISIWLNKAAPPAA
jgi:hypothetical protein